MPSVSSLTYNSGSTYQFDIEGATGTAGVGYDSILDTGKLTLAGGSTSDSQIPASKKSGAGRSERGKADVQAGGSRRQPEDGAGGIAKRGGWRRPTLQMKSRFNYSALRNRLTYWALIEIQENSDTLCRNYGEIPFSDNDFRVGSISVP